MIFPSLDACSKVTSALSVSSSKTSFSSVLPPVKLVRIVSIAEMDECLTFSLLGSVDSASSLSPLAMGEKRERVKIDLHCLYIRTNHALSVFTCTRL